MAVAAKICGINSIDALDAAVTGGAALIGLVFFPRSPRNLTPEQAGALAALVPAEITVVGLLVDPDDATLADIAAKSRIDLWQLHGKETPERVARIKQLTGKPVMKAISVAGPEDVASAEAYIGAADRLLFDAKPPADLKDAMPGGNALAFDWELLGGRSWPCPWMLSGGLDPDNVTQAVAISGAHAVDVSSGVESAPGVKDPDRIRAFLYRVAAL
ncbi:MAG: phosphoribosylanthranilate isomerase [Rhodospirillales bacterium]|nr:phosphoribosylanthranilate isomerase [Rhodospirillales bacterium]